MECYPYFIAIKIISFVLCCFHLLSIPCKTLQGDFLFLYSLVINVESVSRRGVPALYSTNDPIDNFLMDTFLIISYDNCYIGKYFLLSFTFN